jgi:hypothetical protein
MALAAVMASGAFAQRGGGGGGRGGGMGGGGGFPAPVRVSKSEEIGKELKLNKDQKAELETILNEARAKAQPLAGQLNDGRVAIVQAHLANKAPDEAIQKLAALDAQLLAIEADAFTKIMAKVDPKQKAKGAPKAFDLLTEYLSSPGGMGMGGRGGR